MKNKKIAAIAGALVLLTGFAAGCATEQPQAGPGAAVEETAAPEADAPTTEEPSEEVRQAFTTARATLSSPLVQANVTAFTVDEAVEASLTEAIATAEAANATSREADDLEAATAELTAATEALEAAREAAEAARG